MCFGKFFLGSTHSQEIPRDPRAPKTARKIPTFETLRKNWTRPLPFFVWSGVWVGQIFLELFWGACANWWEGFGCEKAPSSKRRLKIWGLQDVVADWIQINSYRYEAFGEAFPSQCHLEAVLEEEIGPDRLAIFVIGRFFKVIDRPDVGVRFFIRFRFDMNEALKGSPFESVRWWPNWRESMRRRSRRHGRVPMCSQC